MPRSAKFPVHWLPQQENLPHAVTTNINTRHLNHKCQRKKKYSQPYKAKGRKKSTEPSPATAMRIQSHNGKWEPTTAPDRYSNKTVAFGLITSPLKTVKKKGLCRFHLTKNTSYEGWLHRRNSGACIELFMPGSRLGH